MKRFHNPMTVPMLIIMSVAFISVTVVFLAVESLSLNFVYRIIIGMFLLILLIIAIGERHVRKKNKKYSEEIGEKYNTAGTVSEIVRSSPKPTLLTVLGVILFIAGPIALFMFNALIGGVVIVTFLFSLLFIVLITSKERNSVEEYIAVPIFGKARKYMQEIHNQVLSLNPAIVSVIGTEFYFDIPIYAYIKNEPAYEFYMLFSMDTIFGGGRIRICPFNPAVFSEFAERIKQYKSDGNELFMPTKEPFDYGLIADIVKFNIEQICMMPQIEHNG